MSDQTSSWEVADEAAMRALGASIADGLLPGSVLGLVGALGAGKTQFVKGLAEGLGFEGAVTSPTFALVNEYRGGSLPLFHFDLYRLDAAGELEALGWDEYLDHEAILAVEWADRFPTALPEDATWWHFRVSEPDAAAEPNGAAGAAPRRVWIGGVPEATTG